MIKNNSAEDQIATMQRLINFGVNEKTENSSAPIVEYKKKAANGKTYGIIREATRYYIMEAPCKDTEVLAEDFDYIGGLNNKKEHEYSSYSKASNALTLKLISINEGVEKDKKINLSQPLQESRWETKITEDMRGEIERFKNITENVNRILTEDQNKNGSCIPSQHTLPEAPAKNPSSKQVNSPFTDTAVANGDKDFTKTTTNHETIGGPFNKDGKITDKEMGSDKKPTKNTDATYFEKAKYVPDNSIVDKHVSGGKVVKVNENNNDLKLRVTEEQILAWSKNKDFMDKSKNTKIGDTAPYTEKLNEVEIEIDDIAGFDDDMDDSNEENYEIIPYEYDFDVDDIDDTDIDNDDIDFDENEIEIIPDNDFEFNEGKTYRYDPDQKFNKKNFKKNKRKNKFKGSFNDDNDDFDSIDEALLNDFGRHPAYRKKPMTLPPNIETAKNGYREWDDESVKGEKPFGSKIGKFSPYDNIIDNISNKVKNALSKKKS